MTKAPYPAAAEDLADRLLRSIRPQVVQIIAEALAREISEPNPGEVQLTEEDYAEAAEVAARWSRPKARAQAGKR